MWNHSIFVSSVFFFSTFLLLFLPIEIGWNGMENGWMEANEPFIIFRHIWFDSVYISGCAREQFFFSFYSSFPFAHRLVFFFVVSLLLRLCSMLCMKMVVCIFLYIHSSHSYIVLLPSCRECCEKTWFVHINLHITVFFLFFISWTRISCYAFPIRFQTETIK